MPDRKITWRTEKNGNTYSGEFEVPVPETLEEIVSQFGEETVKLGFLKSHDIFLQAWARRSATKDEKPLTAEEIAATAPSIKVAFSEREAVDKVEKLLAQFGKLTEEQRAQLQASLQEMIAE